MKALARRLMEAMQFMAAAVVLITMSPLIALVFITRVFLNAWERLELWAYYDGDEKARARDRWKHS